MSWVHQAELNTTAHHRRQLRPVPPTEGEEVLTLNGHNFGLEPIAIGRLHGQHDRTDLDVGPATRLLGYSNAPWQLSWWG